jgi:hypothetical protein
MLASAGVAAEQLGEISWTKLQEAGQLEHGEVIPAGDDGQIEHLKVPGDPNRETIQTLARLTDLKVTRATYALVGEIRYEQVRGPAYLEMWSHFPDGERYFSRTLGRTGDTACIEGSSDWRRFKLPFHVMDSTKSPQKLVLNLVMPGEGTVYLSPVSLRQYASRDELAGSTGSWWSNRAGGMVGGIGGAVAGFTGALIGIVAGLGIGRRLVLALMVVASVAGVFVLGGGIVALLAGQPYAVWYPLTLLGAISAAVFGGLIPVVRQRYTQRELQRISALDAA